jgi:hypothetical protein
MDAILTTLLDLDYQLGGNADLCIGGGLGLYLKQQHLRAQADVRTLLPFDALPEARTTEDIDLFLRADIFGNTDRLRQVRVALDELCFAAIAGAEYFQFIRSMPVGKVKIDLLVGPLGEFATHTRRDDRRVRARVRGLGVHAHAVEEAVAIEAEPQTLPIAGRLSSGAQHSTLVYIPQTFSYLLMKLTAFRDRFQDANKELGRHHALDAYRLIGLLTRGEDAVVRKLSEQHRDAPAVVAVRRVVQENFRDPDAPGILRIREHALYTPALRLDEFCTELGRLFPPP